MMLKNPNFCIFFVVSMFFSLDCSANIKCDDVPLILEKLVEKDQNVRKNFSFKHRKYNEEIVLVSRENVNVLKSVIRECGWPSRKKFDGKVSTAAWLIAQHADDDLSFQKESLAIIEQQVKDGFGSRIELAYLTDRIKVNLGQEQIYGTQLETNEQGKSTLPEIDTKNIKQLNKNREKIGMNISVEDYIARANEGRK